MPPATVAVPVASSSSPPPAGPHGDPLLPSPRRFPQARAGATYRALLDAARDVFSEKGFDTTQTPDIAARAGVSTGTFYRYFDDKRQAFVEMLRHHLSEVHERVLAKLTPERFSEAGADRRAAIEVVLDVLFAQVRRLPALERVYLEMSLRDPEVAAIRNAFDALGQDSIASLIGALVPRQVVPDAKAAAYVIQHATIEVALAESAARGEARRVGERAVKLALREMIHRYLFPDAPPPAVAPQPDRIKKTAATRSASARPHARATAPRKKR